ncbi:hypothetical protein HPP92_028177 [Vanilla planifolia]|uniref:Uncharacterized protein n=1 Tax=Vanilla planifolia TaxID=51239 RepID=A0A835P9K0_VANPL|nr:hypothetical protein HPP92_028177 [Vanilla planifolia]
MDLPSEWRLAHLENLIKRSKINQWFGWLSTLCESIHLSGQPVGGGPAPRRLKPCRS